MGPGGGGGAAACGFRVSVDWGEAAELWLRRREGPSAGRPRGRGLPRRGRVGVRRPGPLSRPPSPQRGRYAGRAGRRPRQPRASGGQAGAGPVLGRDPVRRVREESRQGEPSPPPPPHTPVSTLHETAGPPGPHFPLPPPNPEHPGACSPPGPRSWGRLTAPAPCSASSGRGEARAGRGGRRPGRPWVPLGRSRLQACPAPAPSAPPPPPSS